MGQNGRVQDIVYSPVLSRYLTLKVLSTAPNTVFTGGAGGHIFRERSVHHIPSPGAELCQNGLSFGSGSGTSQTRRRYLTLVISDFRKGLIIMYLSQELKRKVFRSFVELTECVGKDGRVSYSFEGSTRSKKQIARELSHTGNGYIFGDYLNHCKYSIDSRGWINIRDLNEMELRELIEEVIESFL